MVTEQPWSIAPRLQGMRLLVADDSAMNRELVRRMLELEGAETTLASDGEQALQILLTQAQAFDGVLMDVRMPLMDGLTATALIRREARLRELPIVGLTAGVSREEREAARLAGMDEILPKPLDLERLVELLRRRLTSHSPIPTAAAELGTASAPPPAGVASPLQAHPTLARGRDPHRDGEPAHSGHRFPEIAGIDRDHAARVLGNDRAVFLKLLGRFNEEFADIVGRIGIDLARGDRASAARCLHTLKGGARTLGAMDLMSTAGELERTIERGGSDPEKQLVMLGDQLADLMVAIRPWLSAPPNRTATSPQTSVTATPQGSPELEALRDDLTRKQLRVLKRLEGLRPLLVARLGEDATSAFERAANGLRFNEALTILDGVSQKDASANGQP